MYWCFGYAAERKTERAGKSAAVALRIIGKVIGADRIPTLFAQRKMVVHLSVHRNLLL